MITLIAAIGPNRELGLDNQLIYHATEDVEFFKSTTMGHKVVMGSKTFQSIGHPLPGRENFVVTKHPESVPDGVTAITDFEAFLEEYRREEEEVFIIGGACIYSQALRCAQTLLLTEFNYPREADVFFPEFDPVFFDREVLQELPDGKIYKYTYHPWKIPPRYTML